MAVHTAMAAPPFVQFNFALGAAFHCTAIVDSIGGKQVAAPVTQCRRFEVRIRPDKGHILVEVT